MQMMTAIPVASSQPSGQVSASTGATSGMANGQKGALFGRLLVQHLAGQQLPADSAGTPVATLPATYWMGLISQAMGDDAAAVQGLPDHESVMKWLELLLSGQENLDKLLEDGEFLSWLQQAAEWLMGMNLLPLPDHMTDSTTLDVLGKGYQPEKAARIIQAFLAADEREPNNPLLEQLKDKLGRFLRQTSDETAANGPQRTQSLAALEAGDRNGQVTATNLTMAKPVALESVHTQTTTVREPNQLALFGLIRPISEPGTAYASQLEQLQAVQSGTALENNPSMQTLQWLGLHLQPEHAGTEGVQTGQVPGHLNLDPLSNLSGDKLPISGPVQPVLDHMNHVASPKDGSSQVVHVRHFAEEMTNLIQARMQLKSLPGGVATARITLVPETLGQVEVRLTLKDGQVAAQFAAHTAQGKEALESQLPLLRAALVNQGFQVDKLEVVQQQAQSYQSGLFQDSGQQQSAFRQYSSRQGKAAYEAENQGRFISELEALELESELLEPTQGGTFEAKA